MAALQDWTKVTLTTVAIICLSGCATLASRHDTAAEIAASAHMNERVLSAGVFNLTAWERVQKPEAPADVYIEGDGLAWLDKYTKSLNPTPPDPLALRLAAADKNENVIYLARPCQYTGWNREGACPDLYWTSGSAAPEVIVAYQQALDGLKARYHLTGFNLIGYSGGAAIAVLAAAGRQDVLSIRTVAGNTDYDAFAAFHKVSPLKDSIDPVTVAVNVAHVPQLHFIGGKDKVVPEAVYNGWNQASGESPCIHSKLILANDHAKGWVEAWPELLAVPVLCADIVKKIP